MVIRKCSQLESCVCTCMYMYVCTCTLHVPNVFEFLIGHIRDFNVQSEKQMEKGVRKTRTLF